MPARRTLKVDRPYFTYKSIRRLQCIRNVFAFRKRGILSVVHPWITFTWLDRNEKRSAKLRYMNRKNQMYTFHNNFVQREQANASNSTSQRRNTPYWKRISTWQEALRISKSISMLVILRLWRPGQLPGSWQLTLLDKEISSEFGRNMFACEILSTWQNFSCKFQVLHIDAFPKMKIFHLFLERTLHFLI